MPVPASIDDLSTTAGSNSPQGSETPAEGDNYIRSHGSFIALLRDKLNGTSDTGTVKNATFSGTMAGAASWAGLQTFAAGLIAPTSGGGGNVTYSASWTPTPTIDLNLDAVTVVSGHWIRVGTVVFFSLTGTANPTSGAVSLVQFRVPPPIASSFTNSAQCAGTMTFTNGGASVTYEAGVVSANTTADAISFSFTTNITSSSGWTATGSYVIV
jgi:hypothetical protein